MAAQTDVNSEQITRQHSEPEKPLIYEPPDLRGRKHVEKGIFYRWFFPQGGRENKDLFWVKSLRQVHKDYMQSLNLWDFQSLVRTCRLFFFSVTGQYRVLEDECLADKLQNEECK